MSKLVIAEKPSVAMSIAKVIGANSKGDGFVEGNGYIVSWCVGHLIELAGPETYGERFKKWDRANLPIIPKEFQYQISGPTKRQFYVLKKLMEQKGIDMIVNACDAGREGELIFRLVYEQAKCRKPIQRLWISSMEDSAIREGMENLKPGCEYEKLYEAALCRERADWLVGMNGTRLFSCTYGPTLNVGRVMTPTLAMIVKRDAEVKAFESKPFFTVNLVTNEDVFVSRRFDVQDEAIALLEKCRDFGKLTVTSSDTKEKREKVPQLFDLTALQREANKRYGYTAQQTLDVTQSLYEKKLVTYPRTDSRFITEDMADRAFNLAMVLTEMLYPTGGLLFTTAQIVNDKKVTDHTAIIPTETAVKFQIQTLSEEEQKILKLIEARFLVSQLPMCVNSETKLIAECAGEEFECKFTAEIDAAWKGVEREILEIKKKASTGGVALERGGYNISDSEVKEGKTEPPSLFTEDTLLSAMEKAGAEDMPEEAERKGIGTPATRAGTIEKLVRVGYVTRKGEKKTKYLVPTDKGISLIAVAPEEIQSAAMTADWEQKLLYIERGEYEAEAFMAEIEAMITELVNSYEKQEGLDFGPNKKYKQKGKVSHGRGSRA